MTPSHDSEAVLREWRQKILNRFLVIAALAMVPPCVLVVVDAISRPDRWPAAEVFAALLLLLAVLAFWRRLDSRVRAGGLLVVGYVAAVLALARGGLAGTGREYLLILPVFALILLGVRSGVLMSVLSALILTAFAILADRGVLSLWLIDRENSVRLVDWISEGTYTLALLAAAVVLLALFYRFQVRTIDQEQRARAEADRMQALLAQHNATLERRVAERTDELREWEQRLADIIDFLPDATMAIDREGKVIIWNRAMEELAGVPAAEVLGQGDYEYSLRLYGERRPILIDLALLPAAEVEERYAYIRREGELLIGEAYVPLLRNEPAFLWGVAAALHDSQGAVVGAIETIRDITERKKSEEALRQAKAEAEAATRAKSGFLATMSHEIRTPMNAIIGMTGLMLDTPLTREQREFAETIRFSGDALLTIINDILDFSKIEAGRMELEQQPFLLRDCVEGAVDLLAAKANEKGLNLACVIEPDTPPAIFGDVTRLRQILVNLLANAVKFTEGGEVVLTVTSEMGEGDRVTRRQGPVGFITGQGDEVTGGHGPADRGHEAARDDHETPVIESLQSSPAGPGHLVPESPDHRVTESPGQVLHFTVRDTGVGIAAEGMARLFQSFSQVDASTTRRFGGTGLGLAISKRLVELMGGTMWAESEGVPGRGSTFHFTIQARVAEPGPAVDRQNVQPNLRGKRVLIVDDNATNRRILSLQAQSWGMAPCETGSPAEALAWLQRGDQFAMAFLDLHMPGMDGIELSAEIRKLRTDKQLPLVMLSSQARRETNVPEGRFAAFLAKPIKASQIYNVLVELFAGQAEPAGATAPAQPHYDATLGERHPLRLLLAEDNRINQKVALLMLGRLGYRADVAANGLEAMQSLRRQAYDVVLMDVQMPEMDGLEATRAIWREWPTEGRPRVVAMTANATEEDRAACLAAGMDDYLSKPILVEELVAALLRCSPNPSIAGISNQS